MTVTPPDLPSRAGSLDLIADDLALNFANTESGRGFPSHQNHFREAMNVVEWLRHAKALPVEETDQLRKRVAESADLAADLLSRRSRFARRSTILAWRLGIAPNRRRRRSPASPLSMRDVSPRPSWRLALTRVAGHGACALRRSRRRLGPIALAAVRLFTEGDFHRIRECGGHACGWLFYDRSKNNRRRWCEMEVCGNRAKQRRLAARRREA